MERLSYTCAQTEKVNAEAVYQRNLQEKEAELQRCNLKLEVFYIITI